MTEDQLCFSTTIHPDDSLRCGIHMTLKGESKAAWLDLLNGSDRVSIQCERYNISIEKIAEDGEEWPARKLASSSLSS